MTFTLSYESFSRKRSECRLLFRYFNRFKDQWLSTFISL